MAQCMLARAVANRQISIAMVEVAHFGTRVDPPRNCAADTRGDVRQAFAQPMAGDGNRAGQYDAGGGLRTHVLGGLEQQRKGRGHITRQALTWLIVGHAGGGAGNDLMVSGGGSNTFLFNGLFGNDRVEGYQASDKLVFMGIPDLGQQYDYRSHVSMFEDNALLSFGDNSVTLVGVNMTQLNGAGIYIS